MAARLFLIFNHDITGIQEEDAKQSLGVDTLVDLPPDMKRIWSDIPPGLKEIRGYLQPVMEWLGEHAEEGDFVLIQGDFGACYLMVRFCFENGLVPIYSTSRREAVEEHLPDGSISLNHVFKHKKFRRYGE